MQKKLEDTQVSRKLTQRIGSLNYWREDQIADPAAVVSRGLMSDEEYTVHDIQ